LNNSCASNQYSILMIKAASTSAAISTLNRGDFSFRFFWDASLNRFARNARKMFIRASVAFKTSNPVRLHLRA
jgi:hypothetical protein